MSVSVLPDIERLHRRVVVVERVDPHAGRRQCIAAVAAGAPQRRGDHVPGIARVVDIGGIEVAGRGGYARRAVGHPAGLGHRPASGASNHRGIVGAVDGDGDHLGGVAHCHRREGIGQRAADIERLHGRVVVVERVDPDAVGGQRVAAVATGGGGCADRRPARRIVDVGGIQIPGRGGYARRAVGDTAGFKHRPGKIAADHRGVIGAIDGDRYDLQSAVDGGDGEAVGQSVAGAERLHGGIAVVQRVGPDAGRCQRVAAVAVGAGGRRADRGPGIARVVDIGGIEVAGRGRDARNAGTHAAGLDHAPRRLAADHGGVVGAVDGDGDQLGGAVDREGGERVGQRLPGIERLHGRVAVVERVGPEAVGRQREAAEAAGAGSRRADRRPVRRIVDVGGNEVAGRGGRARRAVGDAAGLGRGPRRGPGDDRGVIGAVDGNGDQLRRCRRP